jgi:hypothetical protein
LKARKTRKVGRGTRARRRTRMMKGDKKIQLHHTSGSVSKI